MTSSRTGSLADRTIAALRAEHDTLVAAVAGLTPDELAETSGSADWSVAQVLSHLGSGAEITLAGLQAALGERPVPDESFNPSVWDRWNAMSPADQRAGAIEHGERLVAAFETLDADQRSSLALSVGFLPFPLGVAAYAGMRLNEAAQHGWDARVAADPAAQLLADSAQVLAAQFVGDLSFLLGFAGKADRIAGPAVLDIEGSGFGIAIDDAAAFVASPQDVTATFAGPLEAAVRMIAGRLGAEHTPAGVTVTGGVSLDDLRAVFPGY